MDYVNKRVKSLGDYGVSRWLSLHVLGTPAPLLKLSPPKAALCWQYGGTMAARRSTVYSKVGTEIELLEEPWHKLTVETRISHCQSAYWAILSATSRTGHRGAELP